MTKAHPVDGFYTGYFTGAAGNSIGIFLFREGVVVGADAGGGRYDGSYKAVEEENKIIAKIRFVLPVGNFSVTGATADKQPISVEMSLELPPEFNPNEVHLLHTPLGPVNAKFEKIRGV